MSTIKMCDHYGIFWDIENCPVPKHQTPNTVVKAIRDFVSSKCKNGCSVECDFVCACDVRKLEDRNNRGINDALNKNGVDVLSISYGGKIDADKKLIDKIQKHVEHHSSDSTLVLITGDSDFGATLRTLLRRKMNLILIYGQNASQDLRNILREDQCFFFDKIIKDYANRNAVQSSTQSTAQPYVQPYAQSFAQPFTTFSQPQYTHRFNEGFNNYLAQLRQNVAPVINQSLHNHSATRSSSQSSAPKTKSSDQILIDLADDWGESMHTESGDTEQTQTSISKSQPSNRNALTQSDWFNQPNHTASAIPNDSKSFNFLETREKLKNSAQSSQTATNTQQSQPQPQPADNIIPSATSTALQKKAPQSQTVANTTQPKPQPKSQPQAQSASNSMPSTTQSTSQMTITAPQLKTKITLSNIYDKQLLQVLDFIPHANPQEVLDMLYRFSGDVYAVIDRLLQKTNS